jgi:small-conductance mechanosensitive channel
VLTVVQKNKDSLIVGLVLCISTYIGGHWFDKTVFTPILNSDFGKVHQLTCQRTEVDWVTCQNERFGLLQRSSTVKTFQLTDVSFETWGYPESPPTFALHLWETSTTVTITYEDYDQAQSDFHKLKEFLVGRGESFLLLRYGSGLVRTLVIALLGSFMLFIIFIQWMSFLALLGVLLEVILAIIKRLFKNPINRDG